MNEQPVAPGQILAGKYRIERVLGAGAMGLVLATDSKPDDRKLAQTKLVAVLKPLAGLRVAPVVEAGQGRGRW